MRIKRRGGAVHVSLQGIEAQLLAQVLDELDDSLDRIGPGDPVWDRLNPAALGDPDDASEFREMIGDDLDAVRRGRLGACREQLASGGSSLVLDDEALERWLTVVNDVRLTLGVRLDITAADDGRVDPADPQARARSVYYWLTAVQSDLVDAAMRA